MTDTARERGWGDPTKGDYQRAHIMKVTAGGITVNLRVEVADVFRYLITQLAKDYPLKGYADDWGYCCRPIRGYEDKWQRTHDFKYLSNHSWGLAVDLDSSVNPMSSDPSAKHEFIRAIVEPILHPFGGRLIWGGDYSGSRKDYMHLEYIGTPAEAKRDSATARALLNPPQPASQENDMVIVQAPGHTPVRLPGWVALDTKTLPIYRDKLGVPVKNISSDEFMALVNTDPDVKK